MTPKQLIDQLDQGPVNFNDVIATIEAHYHFTPCEFKNGDSLNQANTNNGSCKIFGFAKLHSLSQQATLNAFGDFYTLDVCQHPNNNDHQNIRNFMRYGWEGIVFEGEPLLPR